MSSSVRSDYGYPLSREFLEQYEINSRQLSELLRAKRAAAARICFLSAVLLAGLVVIVLAVWKSANFIDRTLLVQTLGPIFDFGASLLLLLGVLVVLLVLLYWLVLSILGSVEARARIESLVERQTAIIGEMAKYVEGDEIG